MMMPQSTSGLLFKKGCMCAGTGCGGHLEFVDLKLNYHPIGWQGAAQHTYTPACDGFHAPGACPDRRT